MTPHSAALHIGHSISLTWARELEGVATKMGGTTLHVRVRVLILAFFLNRKYIIKNYYRKLLIASRLHAEIYLARFGLL